MIMEARQIYPIGQQDFRVLFRYTSHRGLGNRY